MFHKIKLMQHLIDYPQVHVVYAGGWSKTLNPTVSLVCFSINGYQIIMASRHFKSTETKVKKNKLYEDLDICFNCDLSPIEHGTENDVPDINMPKFLAAASKIQTKLEENKGKSVLVNCNNGRSRTGTVVALYLMKYHKLPAHDAITIVTSVLRFRGIVKDSINIQTKNLHGNYGDWLRRWEEKNKGAVNEIEVDSPKQFFKKRKIEQRDDPLIVKSNHENLLPTTKKQKLDKAVTTPIQKSQVAQVPRFFNINFLDLNDAALVPTEAHSVPELMYKK